MASPETPETRGAKETRRTREAIGIRRRLRPAAIAGIGSLLLATGCTWKSWAPRERAGPLPATAPSSLTTLTLDEPHAAVLDCEQQDCNHWYRVAVPEAGELQVAVDTEEAADRQVIRVLVRELGRQPLAQTMGDDDGKLRLDAPVQPGLYLVLVQAGGARLPYTLTASLAPTAGP